MAQADTVSISVPTSNLPLRLLWQGGLIVALLLLIVIFGALRPEVFLTVGNLRNILEQVAILSIIAAAQTVVMVAGDFDLSVGATATLSGAVVASLLIAGWALPLAIVVGLLVGLAAGLTNGVLVASLRLSPFIATLATMTSIGGLAYIVTGGTTLYGLPEEFFWIGQSRPLEIPMPIFFAAVVAVIVWVVLRFTVIGRRWYALGGNQDVARLAGINVSLARVLAFGVAGLGAAIGGIILVSRLGNATPTGANHYMLYAIAAVFLGMTLLRSGQANLPGTLVGVLIIGVMSNGLNIVGVNSYVQQLLIGIIIIAAVALSALRTRRH
ncbi:ABC transporter permease [Pseudolysinimonas yzui]|uniref:Dolichyl-phosphate beta-glucosyltransferase n=1 Tax=Pseudolysinimonas yzui TaxID=2708254 RepID=A0A8J3GSW6_9MICO|nr:ABC transporter permease [Pseudolysinimonas yzui]GHF23705.1 dolichyl-phosphate beta-glucosyltransferase [Pseudolysinimonas yzui]